LERNLHIVYDYDTVLKCWSNLKDITASEGKFKSIRLEKTSDIDLLLVAKEYNVTFEKVIFLMSGSIDYAEACLNRMPLN